VSAWRHSGWITAHTACLIHPAFMRDPTRQDSFPTGTLIIF